MFVVYFVLGHQLVQLLLTLAAGLRTGIGSRIAFTGDIPIRNFSLSAWGFPPVS